MANNNLTEAAQAATAALFSNASDDAQTAQERRSAARTGKSSGNAKDAQKGVETAQTRRETSKGKKGDDVKVFSFRSWIDEVESWLLCVNISSVIRSRTKNGNIKRLRCC